MSFVCCRCADDVVSIVVPGAQVSDAIKFPKHNGIIVGHTIYMYTFSFYVRIPLKAAFILVCSLCNWLKIYTNTIVDARCHTNHIYKYIAQAQAQFIL